MCPQHDVLWADLTVSEHLRFFAGIKGVPPAEVEAAISQAIKEVGLTEKVHARSKQLSGGQKRKLSVAIALVGGSKICVLDEPTSGMDPYSRRSTWEALQNARSGRVMLLTTHFMASHMSPHHLLLYIRHVFRHEWPISPALFKPSRGCYSARFSCSSSPLCF